MAAISRRGFIKRTLGAGAVLYLYANGGYRIVTAAEGPETYRLRIVHTNDHHARIEPVEVTIQSTPAVTRNFGGVARRKKMFDTIRAEVAAAADPLDKNILFLDAGDVFQGTLYFNQYGGKADQYFYNLLGYDAQTVGNHEFDRGDALLADYVKAAVYPVISANIVAGSDPLKSLITPTINAPLGTLGPSITKVVGAETIGIFGLTTQETKTGSSPAKDTEFADPIATAQAQVTALKTAGATKIVALTHIGYTVDQTLAAQTRGINVIIGGHSHTPLLPATSIGPVGIASQGPYPTIVKDLDGKDVVIVTDWEWGKWIGDLTVSFNAAGEVVSIGSAGSKTGGAPKPVWADGIKSERALLTGELPDVGADKPFQDQIDNVYKPPIATLQKTVIGATLTDLNGGSAFRTQESNMGDLIADALRAKLITLLADIPEAEKLPIVTIINSGGLRASIVAGAITVGKVLEVLPFGNTVARVDVTGAQLVAALENGVSQVESTAGRFPQVSGLKYTWRRYGKAAVQAVAATGTNPAVVAVKGSRIESVQVYDDATKTYLPVDPAKMYRVVTNNFQLAGGDGYNAFTKVGDQADPSVGGATNQIDTGFIMADVVQDYIANSANATINQKTESRITALSKIVLPLVTSAPAAATR